MAEYKFPEEVRSAALDAYESGVRVADISRRYGVSETWVRLYGPMRIRKRNESVLKRFFQSLYGPKQPRII